MPRANWLSQLTDDQIVYADMVVETAKKYGVPPELALAIAKQESEFNPRAIGSAKEIGIMQVKPGTARDLGFTVADMHDPAKNIEAGVKYLREQINTYNAPELAALAYNRGPGGANKFLSGEEDEAGQQYVQGIAQKGGFTRPVEVSEPQQAMAEQAEPRVDETTQMIKELTAGSQQTAAQQERGLAAVLGGGLGALESARRAAGPVVARKAGDVAQYLAQRAEAGRAAAGTPPLYTGAQTSRLLQGTTEADLTGRSRMEAFNTLTAQQAAQRKAQQEVLGSLAKQGVIASPNAPFVEAPTMVASPQGVLISQDAATRMAEQTAREQARPLARITRQLANMPRILGPLGLIGAGYEGTAAVQNVQQEQYPAALAAGAGALGGVMSLFPPTAPIGIPLSIAAPQIRGGLEQTRRTKIPSAALRQMITGPSMQAADIDAAGMVRSTSMP